MQSNFSPARKKKPLTEKRSVGIACIQFNARGIPEVLLVKKRYTYAYADFIHGKYAQPGNIKKNNYFKNVIIKLLNDMTTEEKLDIYTLDFDKMWYRIWLESDKDKHLSIYYHAKTKFTQIFLSDGGSKLQSLLKKSESKDPVWEIPKGRRKNKNEQDIYCALREFGEETNISMSQYHIFPDISSTFSFTDKNVKYINTYFAAVAKRVIKPTIKFGAVDQISEISDIKMMTIPEIRLVDYDNRIVPFLKPIIAAVKKRRIVNAPIVSCV